MSPNFGSQGKGAGSTSVWFLCVSAGGFLISALQVATLGPNRKWWVEPVFGFHVFMRGAF